MAAAIEIVANFITEPPLLHLIPTDPQSPLINAIGRQWYWKQSSTLLKILPATALGVLLWIVVLSPWQTLFLLPIYCIMTTVVTYLP